MSYEKCINCSEYKRCKESSTSMFFFIIGLIATIAIRVVTILVHLNPLYGQIAWYVGVGGFLVFFVYKYKVDTARYKVIKDNNLMAKVFGDAKLEVDDRKILSGVLCAFSSNKDRINYFVIFVSSALALILGVYFDFLR
jgi:hypothetical protein